MTYILSRDALLCTECMDLLLPPICSFSLFSLGDLISLELEEALPLALLDVRVLPPPALLFVEGREEWREYTEDDGGVRGGLLEDPCLLSRTQ